MSDDQTPGTALTPEEVSWAAEHAGTLSTWFASRVVGQEDLRLGLMVALLSRGHVLLESVPGLAKTLAASTLARGIAATFSRVQCTPDLMPADILGTQVFDPSTASFRTELGPVHANFVLLDEINRSSAKTQSAMLEAMQELQTSIGGTTYRLPSPFMVLATQNPIEEEGTYVLPHAQMDRFLLKEVLDYPSPDEEIEVLHRVESGILEAPATPALSTSDVLRLQTLASRVHVDESLKRYIVDLVTVTRRPGSFLDSSQARAVEFGVSPRCSIALMRTARAVALMAGRDHAVPEDVLALVHPVMRHRITLSFEAQSRQVDVDSLIDAVVAAVPTP